MMFRRLKNIHIIPLAFISSLTFCHIALAVPNFHYGAFLDWVKENLHSSVLEERHIYVLVPELSNKTEEPKKPENYKGWTVQIQTLEDKIKLQEILKTIIKEERSGSVAVYSPSIKGIGLAYYTAVHDARTSDFEIRADFVILIEDDELKTDLKPIWTEKTKGLDPRFKKYRQEALSELQTLFEKLTHEQKQEVIKLWEEELNNNSNPKKHFDYDYENVFSELLVKNAVSTDDMPLLFRVLSQYPPNGVLYQPLEYFLASQKDLKYFECLFGAMENCKSEEAKKRLSKCFERAFPAFKTTEKSNLEEVKKLYFENKNKQEVNPDYRLPGGILKPGAKVMVADEPTEMPKYGLFIPKTESSNSTQ
jgi:hypothetical protein